MSAVLSLKPTYYEALKRLTLELIGVKLGPNHTFLIETRLAELARKEGFANINDLVDELFSSGQARLAIKAVSALLERDTHFNSDPCGLDTFAAHIIPAALKSFPGETLRVVSFGCSSGQEPYSIAIKLAKLSENNPDLDFEVVGIDYPSPALDRAKKGVYTHFEVQRGLPIRDLVEYFDRKGEDWVVKRKIREKVTFHDAHLLSALGQFGKMHIVFFRNSLPNYSSPAQIRVLRSLSTAVKPEGYLILATGEAPPGVSYGFEPAKPWPGVYQRRPDVAESAGEVELPGPGLVKPETRPKDKT